MVWSRDVYTSMNEHDPCSSLNRFCLLGFGERIAFHLVGEEPGRVVGAVGLDLGQGAPDLVFGHLGRDQLIEGLRVFIVQLVQNLLGHEVRLGLGLMEIRQLFQESVANGFLLSIAFSIIV